jgi:hypothetical protein
MQPAIQYISDEQGHTNAVIVNSVLYVRTGSPFII